jgi:DNA-binding phage protein
LWQQVKAVIARYGRVATENQKRQAYVPQGAIAIENPVGTAPSFIVEYSRAGRGEKYGSIISLPGVPQEMELLFHRSVAPFLQTKYDLHDVIKVRLLHTSGWSEASIDEQVGDFEELANPTVGLAAHTGIVDIRIAAKAESEADADRMIKDVETTIRARLGTAIFGADEETLEGAALRAAASRGWNVVALESGLDRGLARRLANSASPNLAAVESVELAAGELSTRLHALMKTHSAKAAIGVALFTGGNEPRIEQVLITPNGEETRGLTYGGPPKYAPGWGVNLLLNWLRQTAGKSE